MASEVKAWGGVWGRVTERTRPVEEARKHLDLRRLHVGILQRFLVNLSFSTFWEPCYFSNTQRDGGGRGSAGPEYRWLCSEGPGSTSKSPLPAPRPWGCCCAPIALSGHLPPAARTEAGSILNNIWSICKSPVNVSLLSYCILIIDTRLLCIIHCIRHIQCMQSIIYNVIHIWLYMFLCRITHKHVIIIIYYVKKRKLKCSPRHWKPQWRKASRWEQVSWACTLKKITCHHLR